MLVRRLRFSLMLFAALWLPFQAVAAQTMTLCRHGQAQPVAVTQAAMADEADMDMAADCPMHHGSHDPAPSTGDKDHGLGCDQCGFCHLAATGFMTAPDRSTAVVPADRVFVVATPPIPSSNIPEPPQRPPRRMA
jgi:hypothetical protein